MPAAILLKRSSVPGKVPTTIQLQAGELAINTADSKIYASTGTSVFQINIGGVSRNYSSWLGVSGLAPQETFEFDDRSLLFSQGASQAIVSYIRVPSSYLPGVQINMRVAHYSPSATGNFKFNTVTTLIRKNTDAVNSVTNQLTSTNSDQALTVSNQYIEVVYNLTDATGKVNAVSVSAGDLIRVQLSRVVTTGTDDLADVRMLINSPDIVFA